jgi:hypothetical protein
MASTVSDFRPSQIYGFVRARQLEGTYPGDPQTGVWPITAARVHFGWGAPPEEMWPRNHAFRWPPSEPSGLDIAAKGSVASAHLIGWRHGGFPITSLRKIEIHGLPVAVNCPEQVQPTPRNPNESFIDVPGRRFWFQIAAQPPVYFRSVPLNPTPDGGVIYSQAALRHQLLQISQTQGKPQYQRTQVTIMIGSNCRFRNNVGRPELMPPTYQMR